jgi:hypothetical protein
MTDEHTLKTKTDVIDLVIGFLVDYEKRLDDITERLDRIAEKMVRVENRPRGTTMTKERKDNSVFTISINNPEDYDKIRSIKIEWENEEREYTPEISEIDALLDKIDFTFKENDRDYLKDNK